MPHPPGLPSSRPTDSLPAAPAPIRPQDGDAPSSHTSSQGEATSILTPGAHEGTFAIDTTPNTKQQPALAMIDAIRW